MSPGLRLRSQRHRPGCCRRDPGCPRGAGPRRLPLWPEEGKAKGIPERLRIAQPRPEIVRGLND